VEIKGARFKAFHYDRYNNRHSLLIIDIVATIMQDMTSSM